MDTPPSREIWNTQISKSLACTALRKIPGALFFNQVDQHLRSYRLSDLDEELSFESAFLMFGGSIIEDVLEKGSYWIKQNQTSELCRDKSDNKKAAT